MSVPYERYEDEIHIEDHERSGSESDEEGEGHERRLQRAHEMFGTQWPRQTGTLQIVLGFVLTCLGLAEVIVIPLVQDNSVDETLTSIVKLSASNTWGLGIWGGLVLTITGSIGLRASLYRSVQMVYIFFSVILVDVVAFTVAVIMIIAGYSKHYTTREAMQNDLLFGTHVLTSVFLGLATLLVIHSFTQYYEDVFCGEMQLCKRTIHCCCPCWCPPAVAQHELLQNPMGTDRPPSLPV